MDEMPKDLLAINIRYAGHQLDKQRARKWRQGVFHKFKIKLEEALRIWETNGWEKTEDILWAERVLKKYEEWDGQREPVFYEGKKLVHEDLFDVIRQRRSIRSFEEKDVEVEKLKKIVEAGRWAPCSCNRQTTKFIIQKRSNQAFTTKEELSSSNESWRKGGAMIYVAIDERPYLENEKFTPSMDASAAIQNMLLMAHWLGLGACWSYQADHIDQDRLKKELGLEEYYYVYSAVLVGYPLEYPPEVSRKPLDEDVKFVGF